MMTTLSPAERMLSQGLTSIVAGAFIVLAGLFAVTLDRFFNTGPAVGSAMGFALLVLAVGFPPAGTLVQHRPRALTVILVFATILPGSLIVAQAATGWVWLTNIYLSAQTIIPRINPFRLFEAAFLVLIALAIWVVVEATLAAPTTKPLFASGAVLLLAPIVLYIFVRMYTGGRWMTQRPDNVAPELIVMTLVSGIAFLLVGTTVVIIGVTLRQHARKLTERSGPLTAQPLAAANIQPVRPA